MRADTNRQVGFYWVRFEGEPIVAEYVYRRRNDPNCTVSSAFHWHIPGSAICVQNAEVCELLSKRLPRPA
jgi:hypothetical protein